MQQPSPVTWAPDFVVQVLFLAVVGNLLTLLVLSLLRKVWNMVIKRLLRSTNKSISGWAAYFSWRADVVDEATRTSPAFATTFMVRELARMVGSIAIAAAALFVAELLTRAGAFRPPRLDERVMYWASAGFFLVGSFSAMLAATRIWALYDSLVRNLMRASRAKEADSEPLDPQI